MGVQMKLDGTVKEIWENYRDFTLNNTCTTSSVTGSDDGSSSQLSVSNMAGIFILHICILTIAVLTEIILVCKLPKEQKMIVKNEVIQGAKNSSLSNICPSSSRRKKNDSSS